MKEEPPTASPANTLPTAKIILTNNSNESYSFSSLQYNMND